MDENIEKLCINTIRTLSMDAVQQANSGHPGTPMALAPVAFTLFEKFIRHNPKNPHWPNRDRFILSAGHASMLLYSTLHINGYDIPLEDIKNFRQLHSKCAGHPEYGLAPGIETTTGPLGNGVATSVGFAIAEKWLAQYFNRPGHEILNYKIFAVAGDGCMMEGISGEAASLAGHLGLDNLVWFYDNNHITIEGNTSLAFTEDVAKRFEAYHWFVQHITDVNDTVALAQAVEKAQSEKGRPSMIIVDSHIGFGAPHKQDSHTAHGEPLGEDEIKATKKFYGWDPEKKFFVPGEVTEYMKASVVRGVGREAEWNKKFEAYTSAFPDLAKQFENIQNHSLPEGWDKDLPVFATDEKGVAGRDASNLVQNAVAAKVPWLIGGSADLAPSTKTLIKGAKSFNKENRDGRNFHFGIREHAMGAIVNGMTLSGLRAYGSGFLIFSDYMRPTFRLAGLMEQPSIFIFTHDSIGVGEDGPTHQPIEQVGSLRAIPHLDVIRPADANEVSEAWKYMMNSKHRPATLILSRQALPTIDRKKYGAAAGLQRGGYILADCKGTPDVILIGTGSELQLCVAAYEQLTKEGIKARVVSLPCWSQFERQGKAYWEKVLPTSVRCRIAVEAASSFGWRRYTGIDADGGIVAMRDFGESAPLKALLQEFGFTKEAVVKMAKAKLKSVKKPAPKKVVKKVLAKVVKKKAATKVVKKTVKSKARKR